MTNIQIPNLQPATGTDGTEQFEVVQDGASRRATANQIKSLISPVSSSAPVTYTVNFSVASGEDWLITDGSTDMIVRLPDPAQNAGRVLNFKNVADFLVLSNKPNVITISGALSNIIMQAVSGAYVTMVCDGGSWIVVETNQDASLNPLIWGEGLPTYSFSMSSAGVYSGVNLVRTIWSSRAFVGVINGTLWDGLDDEGNIMPTGTYTIKVLDASEVTNEWLGAVGNSSFPPLPPAPSTPWWHSYDVAWDMAITSTGKIYICAGYNEAFCATYKTTVAAPQVKEFVLPVQFRLTGPVARFVETDDTRAYFAGDNVGTTSFVYAVTVSDDLSYTFPSGTGVSQGGVVYSGATALTIAAGTGPGNIFGNGQIYGFALQKTGNFMIVARKKMDTIYVVDKVSGATISTTSINQPTALTCDPSNDLWVTYLDGGGNPIVEKYTIDSGTGALTAVPGSQITGLSSPLAMDVTPDGTTLRIADGGNSQQIKSYSTTTYLQQSIYGQATGYALGPAVADDKFYFYDDCWITMQRTSLGVGGGPLTFLCHQPDGKLWVADPANARNLLFSVSGSSYTVTDQLSWVPSSYSAAMDPNDIARVFSDWREYRIDYSKNRTEPGWWTLVNYWGFGVAANYNDAYTRMRYTSTLSNGRTYCFPRSYSAGAEIAELTPSGLRFTGVTDSGITTTALMRSGDLHIVSPPTTGNPAIYRKKALTGFNGSNNPIYAATSVVVTSENTLSTDPKPQGGSGFPVRWEVATSGIVPDFDPTKTHTGWHLAGIEVSTGNFIWRTQPSTPTTNRFRYQSSLTRSRTGEVSWPTDTYFDLSSSSSAGGNMWNVGSNIFMQYRGEGWPPGQVNKWWQFHDSGLQVQMFGVVLIGNGEGQQGISGNGSNGTVAESNGNIYIVQNDESYTGGVLLWKVTGSDTIELHEQEIYWDSGDYSPAPPDPNNLLEGLPFDATVPNSTAGWTRNPTTDVITVPGSTSTPPFWVVYTNCNNYDAAASRVNQPAGTTQPDIRMVACYSAGNTTSATRTFPVGIGPQWIFSSFMQIETGDSGSVSSPNAYTRMDVCDASSRVIARFTTNSTTLGVYGNEQLIESFATIDDYFDVTYVPNDLFIRTDLSGNIIFSYAGFPEITTTPFDPLSDWQNPTQFIVTFGFFGAANPRAAQFRSLRIDNQ